MSLKLAVPLLAMLAAGCTAAGGAAVYQGDFIAYDGPPVPRCDNYARQTYYNHLEDNYDRSDSFGVDMINARQAERAGDRAFQRCLEGRLN